MVTISKKTNFAKFVYTVGKHHVAAVYKARERLGGANPTTREQLLAWADQHQLGIKRETLERLWHDYEIWKGVAPHDDLPPAA
jgi:hypothetical protein